MLRALQRSSIYLVNIPIVVNRTCGRLRPHAPRAPAALPALSLDVCEANDRRRHYPSRWIHKCRGCKLYNESGARPSVTVGVCWRRYQPRSKNWHPVLKRRVPCLAAPMFFFSAASVDYVSLPSKTPALLEARTEPRALSRDAHLARTGMPSPSEGPWPRTVNFSI